VLWEPRRSNGQETMPPPHTLHKAPPPPLPEMNSRCPGGTYSRQFWAKLTNGAGGGSLKHQKPKNKGQKKCHAWHNNTNDTLLKMWLGIVKSTLPNHLMGPVYGFKMAPSAILGPKKSRTPRKFEIWCRDHLESINRPH
jgi:hypothetical protein